jgi:L-asparagine transporter-like permease
LHSIDNNHDFRSICLVVYKYIVPKTKFKTINTSISIAIIMIYLSITLKQISFAKGLFLQEYFFAFQDLLTILILSIKKLIALKAHSSILVTLGTFNFRHFLSLSRIDDLS